MHRSAFAGAHWRTGAGSSCCWARTLKNGLSWNWPTRSRTTGHRSNRLSRLRSCCSWRRCSWSWRSFINRSRAGLRHNHARCRSLRTSRLSRGSGPLSLRRDIGRLTLCGRSWCRTTGSRRRRYPSCRRSSGGNVCRRRNRCRRTRWWRTRSHYPRWRSGCRCSGCGRLDRRRSRLGFLRRRLRWSGRRRTRCCGRALLFRQNRL
jgi:hypothetical protein